MSSYPSQTPAAAITITTNVDIRISSISEEELATSLQQYPFMTELALCGELSETAADVVVDCILNHPSLKSIDITDLDMLLPIEIKVIKAIRRNPRIERLMYGSQELCSFVAEDIASMIEDPEHALAEFECMAGELTNGAAKMIVDAIIESGKMRLFHIANVDDWDQHMLFCGCESRVTDFWMYG